MFFISKSPGGHAIYCRNARVLEMQNFTPPYTKGWTYVRTIFSEPKFRGCIVYQIFLPMVLRCSRFARESSAINKCIPWSILSEIGTRGWEGTNPVKIFVVNSTNSFFFS